MPGVCRVWGGMKGYGGHSMGETPGSIPNPEAKAHSADGTATGRLWESRSPPDILWGGPCTLVRGPSCISGVGPALGGAGPSVFPGAGAPPRLPARGRGGSGLRARHGPSANALRKGPRRRGPATALGPGHCPAGRRRRGFVSRELDRPTTSWSRSPVRPAICVRSRPAAAGSTGWDGCSWRRMVAAPRSRLPRAHGAFETRTSWRRSNGSTPRTTPSTGRGGSATSWLGPTGTTAGAGAARLRGAAGLRASGVSASPWPRVPRVSHAPDRMASNACSELRSAPAGGR